MIVHVAEVWSSLAAAFVIGCLTGALLFRIAARSRLAAAQGALADAIGRVGHGVSDRLIQASARRRDRPAARRPVVAAEPSETDAMWEAIERAVDADDDPGPELPPLLRAPEFDEPADDEPRGQAEAPRRDIEPPALVRPPLRMPVAAPRRTQPRLAPPLPIERPSDRSGSPRHNMPVPLFTAPVDGDPAVANGSGEILDSRRPAMLAEPRNGVPDNLQRIKGVGERNEVRLNALGVFHFSQIAAWTPAEIRWIGEQLAFPDRIERDDWVGQAIVLASGGETGFTKSAERRRARRRRDRQAPGNDPDVADDP